MPRDAVRWPDARVPAGAAGWGRAEVVRRRWVSPSIGRPLPASSTLREEGASERLRRRRNREARGVRERERKGKENALGGGVAHGTERD
jgi:hypothetical protein